MTLIWIALTGNNVLYVSKPTDDVPHCPANSNRLSWSSFHAAEIEDSHPVAICTMLPLFQDESKSPSMIKHSMNVIKQAVII